jgi:hypothetical protein
MFMSGRLPSASAIRTYTDPWEWRCGFYPGSHPGEHQSDTTATFEEARADFEHTWQVFLSNRTEADFQAWRDQRDWTEPKYALWDAEASGAVQPWTGQAARPLHEMSLRRGFRFAWPRGGADACARQHERVPTLANVN